MPLEPNRAHMELVTELARELFPDASLCKPLWTPAGAHGNVCVEVWTDGRANVYAEDTLYEAQRRQEIADAAYVSERANAHRYAA